MDGWDETKHPRNPSGSSGGGEFASSASGQTKQAPTTRELADKIGAPRYASVYDNSISYRKPATSSEADKALRSAGFERSSIGGNKTVSEKMGRSEVRVNHTEKISTYVHPSGYQATIKTTRDTSGVGKGHETHFTIIRKL